MLISFVIERPIMSSLSKNGSVSTILKCSIIAKLASATELFFFGTASATELISTVLFRKLQFEQQPAGVEPHRSDDAITNQRCCHAVERSMQSDGTEHRIFFPFQR